jgi:FixJ family two-component response regulator
VSSLRRRAEDTPEQQLSVRSSGRIGRVWALAERLTEDQEREIISAFLAGESKARIGERFKISAKSVQRVVRKHGMRRVDRRDLLEHEDETAQSALS